MRGTALLAVVASVVALITTSEVKAEGVTTIITHGFTPDCGEPQLPGWVEEMALGVREQHGPGAVFHYRVDTGAWELVAGFETESSHLAVLAFNWVRESDTFPLGCPPVGANWLFTQAAGDALYAALRDPIFVNASGERILDGFDLLHDRTVHFIGHSRGTCVNSEAARRLASVSIPVDQITNLDPHPVNGTLDPPLNPNWGDEPAVRWGSNTWGDNYWREDGGGVNAGDFDGMILDGFATFMLNEDAMTGCIESAECNPGCGGFPPRYRNGYDREHSDVHLWYHGTIDETTPLQVEDRCLTAEMRVAWYDLGFPPEVGYRYSVLGGDSALRPDIGEGTPAERLPMLFNGGFEARDDSSEPTVAGWFYHGGGWEGTVSVPPITGFGSTTYAFLGFVAGQRAWAIRHNRFLLDEDATSIEFEYEVIAAGGDRLSVFLTDVHGDSIPVGDVVLNENHDPNEPHLFPVPDAATRPGMYTITFMLDGMDQSEAHVWLDNIRITNLTADDIHYVPSEYSTIQAAINVAQDGDEVVVAPDTYFERITIPDRAMTIRGSGGPEVTIIDGEEAGTVVTIESGAGRGTVLRGFTVREGSAGIPSGVGGFGGGMRFDNASPSVISCVFENNQAGVGGGVAALGESSDPLLSDCVFRSNSTPGVGNAAAIRVEGAAEILGCTFISNTSGNGGGAILSDGVVEVRDCFFSDNHSTNSRGGAIYVTAGAMAVDRCIFEQNSAMSGGAIYKQGGSLLVSNSSFCESTPDDIAPPGSYTDGGGNEFSDAWRCAETALEYDNDVVGVPGAVFDGLGDFTIEFWQNTVEPHPFGGDPSLVSVAGAVEFNQLLLQRKAGDNGYYLHYQDDDVMQFGGDLGLDEWIHVAIVRDGPVIRGFVNGEFADEVTVNDDALEVPDDGVRLGQEQDCVGGCFEDHQAYYGLLDEVRIWAFARQESDIRLNMRRSLTGSEPGLVAYWRSDEGFGQVLRDSSPSQHDGWLGIEPTGPDDRDPAWIASTAPFEGCGPPGDIDGDGDVDFQDLLAVLAAWGPCEGCPEDVNGDGEVNFADIILILSNWT